VTLDPSIEVTHAMKQTLGLVSVVVRDYDEALDFYVGVLGFTLIEDSFIPEQNKRWVVVSPPGARESRLLLARASGAEQESRIGSQTGGRVFLFLYTDDLARDYQTYKSRGVVFVREPKQESYGTVAVFKDLYGNLWDLLQPGSARPHGDGRVKTMQVPVVKCKGCER
jgi:catechol 2,3-dioxygenase-like lactoylglutathione lyase family enzyme